MPTLAERFIEKRSKMSQKLKEIKKKLADQEEYTSPNDLKDIPIIFIGDHSFRNNEIVTLFAPDNRKEETLELFKKVFQNKYPITRHNGIPRVPSRDEDKNLLIDGLSKYFNIIRGEIMELKKKGDSVTIREKIGHLQKINILITHFNEDKETFPYQNFKDYLSNKEFVDSVGDIDEGLKYVKGEEEEEKRVRNLLRQFIKVYLQNKSAQDFSVHGDGIFSDQLKEFKEKYDGDEKKGKIPQVLIYLMEILEGERMKVPEKSEYDFKHIYTLLESLRNKFADAEEDKDPQFPTQDGGRIPAVKREKLEDTIQEVVDYMIEEYIKLKTGYDSVLRESLSKDSKIASLRNRISIDQDLKKQATNELKTRREIINELNKQISEYIRELAKKNKIIEGLLKKCKEKKMRDDNRNSNLPYDRLINIFGKNYNEFEEEPSKKPSRRLVGINLTEPLDTSSGRAVREMNTIEEGNREENENDNENTPSLPSDETAIVLRKPPALPRRDNLLRDIERGRSMGLRKTPALLKDVNNENSGYISNVAKLPLFKKKEKDEVITYLLKDKDKLDELFEFVKNNDMDASIEKLQGLLEDDYMPVINKDVLRKLILKLKLKRNKQDAIRALEVEKGESYYSQNERNNDGTTVWSQDDFDRENPENYYYKETQENLKRMEEKDNNNSSYRGVRGMFNSNFEEEPEIYEPETQWVSENVEGDGSCFYRSLFKSAFHYYEGSLVKNIYECFGINETDINNEDKFVINIRNSLGDKIKNGIYDTKAESDKESIRADSNQAYRELVETARGLYETFLYWANTDPDIYYDPILNDATAEIKAFVPTPEIMKSKSKVEFYNYLSQIVKDTNTYASEYDIMIVQWILGECSNSIYINMYSPTYPQLFRRKNRRKILNVQKLSYDHYISWYEKNDKIPSIRQAPTSPRISLDKAFELLELNKDDLDILLLERRINNILSAINRKYELKRSLNEGLYLGAKDLLIGYYERKFIDSPEFRDNKVTKDEFDFAIRRLELNGVNPLTHAMIKKKYKQLSLKNHTNKGGDLKIIQELSSSRDLLLKLSEEQIQEYLSMSGGSKESKLLEYSRKVADNRLKEFLKEEPLPLFTLIEEFEDSSNLKVVEKGNEKHIFETFLNYMFEQHFSSEEGKQFYFEAYEILNKKKYFEIAILCFVILENINAIQRSRKDIDTVRMSSTEYNAIFDEFEQTLRKADYDFFTEASKLVPNKTSIKFFEDHIYYHNNTDSFEKTYTINSSLDIDKEHYNFNEELYFINDSTIYLFFIISSYLYMKPNVKLSLEDSINKFSRKMKRTKNKKTKSIGLLLKERKEFNDEELDGEKD